MAYIFPDDALDDDQGDDYPDDYDPYWDVEEDDCS